MIIIIEYNDNKDNNSNYESDSNKIYDGKSKVKNSNGKNYNHSDKYGNIDYLNDDHRIDRNDIMLTIVQ